jgi:hypothetical protein
VRIARSAALRFPLARVRIARSAALRFPLARVRACGAPRKRERARAAAARVGGGLRLPQ